MIAVIENGVVVGSFSGSSLDELQKMNPGMNFVEAEEFGNITWMAYDKETGELSGTPLPSPDISRVSAIRVLPAGAFRLRFNFNERARVELASVINPAGSEQEKMLRAKVKTFYADLQSQREISLDSEGVLNGCKLLDSIGVLDEGWIDRIIRPDATEGELRYGK